MASSTEAVSTPAIADHPVRAVLLLGALGVVFGDIGTSPLYAFREALRAAGGPSEAARFSAFSRSFSRRSYLSSRSSTWSASCERTMRGEERRDDGAPVFSPAGRRQVAGRAPDRGTGRGTSLFFGDAIAHSYHIRALSAVEGLRIVSPMVTPYVVPIAAVVLVLPFLRYRARGSGAVGFLFGPIMAVWFVTLAVVGAYSSRAVPKGVLLALEPKLRLGLCRPCRPQDHVAVLGSVFLGVDRR